MSDIQRLYRIVGEVRNGVHQPTKVDIVAWIEKENKNVEEVRL